MTATVDSETSATAPPEQGWAADGNGAAPTYRLQRAPQGDDRRRVLLAAAVVAVLGAAGIAAVLTNDSAADTLATSDEVVSDVETGGDGEVAEPADGEIAEAAVGDGIQAAALPDLEGNLGQNELESDAELEEDERADGGCTIGALSIRVGDSGTGVTCLQDALIGLGYLSNASGSFDDPTLRAVMQYQEDAGLFVDGVVGRESAVELDIWPDEESLVVHTPAPAAGAMDSMGYRLSPVASTGADAPPLPENSGSGRRVVYDRAGQRVWAVSDDGQIIRSWLVTGSKYMNEQPGAHEVYSRSEMSTAWNGQAWLPQMIRYQKTDIGAIGFHAIPLHVSDNSPYQGVAELGTRLSGGCQRQHNDDSAFMWHFAQVGTPVIVT